MAGGFGADVDQLRAAGLFLQQAAGDLRTAEVAPVRTAYEGLLATWRGPDQARFRVAVDAVLETADLIVNRLETTGLMLLSAGTTYADGQRRQAGAFDRVGGLVDG